MNATTLAERLAQRTGLSRRAARAILDATLAEIVAELATDGRVGLSGFGAFEVRTRSPRERRHPRTGVTISSPGTRTVVFRPGTELKSALGESSDAIENAPEQNYSA